MLGDDSEIGIVLHLGEPLGVIAGQSEDFACGRPKALSVQLASVGQGPINVEYNQMHRSEHNSLARGVERIETRWRSAVAPV